MRAVVQRVASARVEVGGQAVARIGPGLVAFVAVEVGDGAADVQRMARRLVHLRVFDGPDGRLRKSVLEAGGEVLLVSNFTVAGECRRGRRPDFTRAADAASAKGLFEALAAAVSSLGARAAVGSFGASMEVTVVNDGPVTLVLTTRDDRPAARSSLDG